MNRLTRKIGTIYCKTIPNKEKLTLEERKHESFKITNAIYDKFGKLEDLEEELGIDLFTLFKAKQIYWRIRYIDTGEYSEIKKSDRVHLDLKNRDLKVYEEYDDFGFSLDLKDYGKTWSLTKEELENV